MLWLLLVPGLAIQAQSQASPDSLQAEFEVYCQAMHVLPMRDTLMVGKLDSAWQLMYVTTCRWEEVIIVGGEKVAYSDQGFCYQQVQKISADSSTLGRFLSPWSGLSLFQRLYGEKFLLLRSRNIPQYIGGQTSWGVYHTYFLRRKETQP